MPCFVHMLNLSQAFSHAQSDTIFHLGIKLAHYGRFSHAHAHIHMIYIYIYIYIYICSILYIYIYIYMYNIYV